MKLTLPAAKTWHGGWWSYPGHRGQDFGWGSGDQIIAAAPGTVVEIYDGGGYNGGWGNRIVISHGGNNYTTYNHIATGTIAVSMGESVGRGQFLAHMGSTGESTAKHLHFELERGGRGAGYRVDPAPYYNQDLPGTGGDPTPATLPEEDEEMNTGIYYMQGSDQINAIVNTSSGYFGEYSTGGTYNNEVARGFRTGSFVKVTKSHFEAIKRQCAEVRAGK